MTGTEMLSLMGGVALVAMVLWAAWVPMQGIARLVGEWFS